jgi:hypothetical protein
VSVPASAWPRLVVAPRRYNGAPKFRYPVDALEIGPPRWALHGIFGSEIGPHSQRLGFYPGDHTIELYEAERWFNVYAVFSPDGELRGYYCNLATPPAQERDELTYVDLDLDLLVRPDGRYELLDRDEYEEHAARLGYPDDLRARVDQGLRELIGLIERRQPPFDGVEARRFFHQAFPAAGR